MDIEDGLSSPGHGIHTAAMPHGGWQIIGIDYENGVMIAGSDPRKNGTAAEY